MARFRLFVLLLDLSLVSGSISQRRQIDPEIERKINEFIHDKYLPLVKVSTLTLTIVQNDGEIFYTNGYGWANEDKQIPNTNDTLFIIGSSSKSFTAVTLLAALHEKFPNMGEAVLDTPIRELIPEYNLTLIDRFRSEHGTIRDVLGHRFCLPRTDWIVAADSIESRAEIAYRQRYNKEACGFRTAFEYQNQIYVLAGEILSLLTNKPYEEVVEDFMKEIGMEKSRFIRSTDDFANTPEIARPYFVSVVDGSLNPMNPQLPLRIIPQNAAGGILSSANEVSRYLRFHANHGKIDGKQIVPEEVMRWTRNPIIHVPSSFGAFAYGQGLFISQYRGWEHIHHGGDWATYHSLMSWFPTQNLSVFTSTNQGPVGMARQVLHKYIFDVLNGEEDAEARAEQLWNELELKEEANRKDQEKKQFLKRSRVNGGGHIPKRAEELVGKYGNEAAGQAEIFEKWNNETNEMGVYIQCGKWVSGFLETHDDPDYDYLIKLDTDMNHDFLGLTDNLFLKVVDDTIEFIIIEGKRRDTSGIYKLGVNLDNLPPVPWLAGSC